MTTTASHHNESDHVVVVGVDGSDTSTEALRWAARQAELTGSSLEVVMACAVPMAVYSAPYPIPAAVDVEASRKLLDRIIGETLGDNPPIKVSATCVEGPASLELLKAAEHADLLVVGSRGHTALVGVLLGSVSEHCIAHAPCPVTVVRTQQHKQEAKS